MASKASLKALEAASKRWDRATAYGCAQRQEPYSPERCQQAWEAYRTLLAVEWPEAWGHTLKEVSE